MNESLRRAVEALQAGASDVSKLSLQSASEVRERLRRTVEEVLDRLEEDERARQGEPEDIISQLDRQSKDIAEDLRRVDELMKRRTQGF